jgi:hypothetical protein
MTINSYFCVVKTNPYSTSSKTIFLRNSQNSDYQNLRSIILSGFYQILSSDNPSSVNFARKKFQSLCHKDRSKAFKLPFL